MNKRIGFIVFSKDRGMQLDYMLRSIFSHCKKIEEYKFSVIYKCENNQKNESYEILNQEYKQIRFIKEKNLKYDLLISLLNLDYVFFCFDDNYFINDFDVEEIIQLLVTTPTAIGFSLRLGKNINNSYSYQTGIIQPDLDKSSDKFLRINWVSGEFEFGYPFDLSSSIYDVKNIYSIIKDLKFNNPKELEVNLHLMRDRFKYKNPDLFCYIQSRCLSVPLNKVKRTSNNLDMHLENYSSNELDYLFRSNFRIENFPLIPEIPSSCHVEIEPIIRPKRFVIPKISIIITCFNSEVTLLETLESVIHQTYHDFEIIIVDDKSTDTSLYLITKFKNANPEIPITIIKNENNQGPTLSRIKAVAYSKGGFLLPLDSDDRLAPTFLEETLALLNKKPKAGYVYVDVITFGNQYNYQKQYPYNFKMLLKQGYFAYCSLIRKEAFVIAGGYDTENWGYAEDRDLWIRMGKKGWHGVHLSRPLFYYRVRNSLTSFIEKIDANVKAYIQIRNIDCYPKSYLEPAVKLVQSLPENWYKNPPFSQYTHVDVTEKQKIVNKGIKTTVYILTIGDPSFDFCFNAIKNQEYQNFLLKFVPGIRPFSKAFRTMIEDCNTPYFIQIDEDMILNKNAVKKMEKILDDIDDDIAMVCFYLYDFDRECNIQGVKIWKAQYFKDLDIESVVDADMDPLEKVALRGGKWISYPEVLGKHGIIYTPETIYRRYKTMYENEIVVWNILTNDIFKKKIKYRNKGDINDLFALIGSIHGIINSTKPSRLEKKDFIDYQPIELKIFLKLLKEKPPKVMEYSSSNRAFTYNNKPLDLDKVNWKRKTFIVHWNILSSKIRIRIHYYSNIINSWLRWKYHEIIRIF